VEDLEEGCREMEWCIGRIWRKNRVTDMEDLEEE